MWISLFARFWPYLVAVVGLIGLALYLNHAGYKSGYAASEAKWQPLFAAAQIARDEANARAAVQEARSTELSAQTGKKHAEQMASLNLRAADAEQRTAGLVRQLSARARCSSVREAGGSAPVPDAVPASDPIADRASKDLVELARRCESDAETLAELQHWVTEQRAIFN